MAIPQQDANRDRQVSYPFKNEIFFRLFIRRVKQGVLQFVLIKPITAILAILLNYYGLYCDGDWNRHCGYIYISSINNTSVSISLYYLVLFYLATEERLAPFKPFHKFLSVKAILVMSFW